MKLQIDTKEKTIKVDEDVKFKDLIKVLNKLLPKEWEEYTLQTNSTITWTTYPVYPWTYTQPWSITMAGTCENGVATTSVYNVDVIN